MPIPKADPGEVVIHITLSLSDLGVYSGKLAIPHESFYAGLPIGTSIRNVRNPDDARRDLASECRPRNSGPRNQRPLQAGLNAEVTRYRMVTSRFRP